MSAERHFVKVRKVTRTRVGTRKALRLAKANTKSLEGYREHCVAVLSPPPNERVLEISRLERRNFGQRTGSSRHLSNVHRWHRLQSTSKLQLTSYIDLCRPVPHRPFTSCLYFGHTAGDIVPRDRAKQPFRTLARAAARILPQSFQFFLSLFSVLFYTACLSWQSNHVLKRSVRDIWHPHT